MISIGDIISLIEKGRDFKRFYASSKARKFDKFISVFNNKDARLHLNLYEFLTELYFDVDILVGPESPFPMGILELSSEVKNSPNTILGRIDSSNKKEITILEPELVNALKRKGVKIWNGNTFSLDHLVLDHERKVSTINAYIGSYFNMISSADYLELELLAAIAQDKSIDLTDFSARRATMSEYNSPLECLKNGGGVDAVIAISTLVVYLRDNRYWLLCDVRSKEIAEYGDLYHVIPSFIFQPVTGVSEHNLKVEWSITHNIYREYLEELFNVPEVEQIGKPVAPDFFYRHPNLLLLQSMLNDGSAKIKGVALGFNLFNHRPEILTLLLIEDELWYECQKDVFGAKEYGVNHLNLSNEFLTNEPKNNITHLDIVTTLPLDDNHWANIAKPWLMVPPGAPALVLGAKAAVSYLGITEPEWLKKFTIKRGRIDPFEK